MTEFERWMILIPVYIVLAIPTVLFLREISRDFVTGFKKDIKCWYKNFIKEQYEKTQV